MREVDGLVLVWFSLAGKPPRWEPEPWVPADREYWDTAEARQTWPDEDIPAQVLVENAVDCAHFQYVHTAVSVPDIEEFVQEGPEFRTVLRYPFGAGKEKTWATPNGPVDGRLATFCHGLGFIYSNLAGFDDIFHILAVAPISPTKADVRATVFVPKLRGDGSPLDEKTRDRWIRQQHNQVAADIAVWSKLSFRARPPFAKSEAHAMRAFKKWCKQFYVSDSASA